MYSRLDLRLIVQQLGKRGVFLGQDLILCAGSKEQIKHNYNGLIVSFDEEEILKSVIQLLENKDLCKKFEINLQKEDINTLQELKKLYSEVM